MAWKISIFHGILIEWIGLSVGGQIVRRVGSVSLTVPFVTSSWIDVSRSKPLASGHTKGKSQLFDRD
jgi:hypothetical protein